MGGELRGTRALSVNILKVEIEEMLQEKLILSTLSNILLGRVTDLPGPPWCSQF